MANDITLTSSVRANLLQLQKVSDQQGAVGSRLSTGLKVASAVDDPVAYFQAKSLKDRASDLRSIKDTMGQGIKTLENAMKALEGAESLIKQMKGLALSAQAESDDTKRAALGTQYQAMAVRLDEMLTDAEYQGVNLVAGSPANPPFTPSLTVALNEDSTASLSVSATDNTSTTLGIATATGGWSTDTTEATGDLSTIDTALKTVRANMQTIGNDLAFLKVRETFTTNLVNTLEDGAGKLVNADLNEESANMLALQTRQSMATNTLSMANQAEQSILQLFR